MFDRDPLERCISDNHTVQADHPKEDFVKKDVAYDRGYNPTLWGSLFWVGQLLLLQPDSGTCNLTILAVAAARDQIVGQFLDIGKIAFRAFDKHQRRAGVAVGHLDRVLRLLEIACNGGFQFFKGVRLEVALSAFNRLQGVRNFRRGDGGFPGDGGNLLVILFIGRGGGETVQLGMRRPRRAGQLVRKFRLPDRSRDKRVDRGLTRPQRQQCVDADTDQNQDQKRWRELNFPGQADVFDPAEHTNPFDATNAALK